MKIWHRVILDRSYDDALRRYGIEHEPLQSSPKHYSSVVFNVDEDNPGWPEIKQIVERHDSFNLPFTEFTDEEILEAEWSRLCPGFEKGYPQPERNMTYVPATFGWRCPSCGLESQQKAPFWIRKDLGMGRNDFASLYWTYSILCTRRVVRKIEEAALRGVDIWPVILHGKDVPSEVLSQLVFPVVAGPGLDPRDMQRPEYCTACGITKYEYQRRGYMHIKRDDVDAQLTYEWFGSNTKTGYREILISNRFARLILEQGWKGIFLKAVALV